MEFRDELLAEDVVEEGDGGGAEPGREGVPVSWVHKEHKEQLRKDLETVPKTRKMSKCPMTTVVTQSGRANVGKF